MAIQKFGQYVLLEVHDETGALVFSTDSLKIDFDIRHIARWSRAKFSITNLAPATIKKLSNGNNYVTVSTSLHGSKLEVVADRMYVSNAMEEVKVPSSVFNMYCYSKLRKLFLEEQIDIQVAQPSLPNIVNACLQEAGFTGSTEFKHFPPEVLDYYPPKPTSKQRGSVLSCFNKLSAGYNFNVYTEGNKFVFMYKPNSNSVASTDFYSDPGNIKLSTNNMRANPKIGPATLSVVSNLDPRIKPATVLDIAELLTAGTSVSEETLQVAEDYLREKVAGFSKYQTLSVQHKGSNWSGTWITQVAATSPTVGTTMPTVNWWA